MTATTPSAPHNAVAASMHDVGIVLLHMSRGRIFTANRVGAAIWQGLARKASVDAIVDQIARAYCVPIEVVRADAISFMAELQRQQLVVMGRT